VRIVFFGTAEFSVPSLRALSFRHDVVAVVTQPDRPGDRGMSAARPVADAARALGVQVLQPARVRDTSAVEALAAFNADAYVVAAYGQIMPVRLLEQPRFGGINVHASLLPRWRGAAPIAYAIKEGDTETGVCIMKMEAGLDTGPVYAQRAVAISRDATTPTLTETLATMGAELLIETLPKIEKGLRPTPQRAENVTSAPRLTKEDGRVDWAVTTAVEVERMVRALQPWPGVMAEIAGAAVKLIDVAIGENTTPGANAQAPGSVSPGPGETISVRAADQPLVVRTVQPPSKRSMSAAAFLRGRR